MNLEKFKNNEVALDDQKSLTGGNDLLDLIQVMWDLTPDNGGSHWDNQGGGVWDGFTWTW
ncbi:MAG: hypothetical protein AB8G15_15675 [Saprospiraceae bacterium]